jgi:hypothetical protein
LGYIRKTVLAAGRGRIVACDQSVRATVGLTRQFTQEGLAGSVTLTPVVSDPSVGGSGIKQYLNRNIKVYFLIFAFWFKFLASKHIL